MIKSSGGDYAYLNEAFGNLPAFLYLWAALFIIIPVGNAIIALAFANYVLQPIWGTCPPTEAATHLVAALAVGKSDHYTHSLHSKINDLHATFQEF